jgi:photosystem II stability/assembly factor-like uncharacterized protein
MKRLLSIAIAAAAATLAAPAGAGETNNAGSTLREPVIRPAVRAANATQATMLAAARAGERIVAVGDRGVVLLSDDGGKRHRQAQTVPIDVPLTSVSFADAKRGWAVGHWGAVLHTTDGGENWVLQRSDVKQDRPLFAVHFFDANHGVAVGLWSLVLVTADGGKIWQTIEVPIPPGAKKADLNLLGLFVDGRGRLFAAAERGMVLRSDDRGRHWSYLPTGYKGSFWTGLSPSDGTLLAAGLRGSLYRSMDDGRTWTRVDTQSKSSITALARIGGDIVGVGLDGLVLRSSDGGASFKAEIRADRVPLTAMGAAADGRPVLYSRQGVVREDTSR